MCIVVWDNCCVLIGELRRVDWRQINHVLPLEKRGFGEAGGRVEERSAERVSSAGETSSYVLCWWIFHLR